ncbi:MAG: histidine phosphatase family protein [Alphaproteobacteria bacterium]|nr:histidine phosphatase family protein [Alphaproteobacteria bacterium]
MSRILLIRHCQSSGQAPDAPLTPDGVRAALGLADRLAMLGADAAYSSPFTRARQTLSPFADRNGLPLALDDRLAERRLSPSPHEDWLDLIRKSFDDLDHAVPGGESLREAQRRGLAALADIAAGGHRLPAVATHGNLLSSILRHADASFGFDSWKDLRNPDLFLVSMAEGRPHAFERLAG